MVFGSFFVCTFLRQRLSSFFFRRVHLGYDPFLQIIRREIFHAGRKRLLILSKQIV